MSRLDRSWLNKIEGLTPGDACEIKDGLTGAWVPAVVVVNGLGFYWRLRMPDGREVSRYIEHVRLPGQLEAWPRYGAS